MCEPTTIAYGIAAVVGAYSAYSVSESNKAQAEYQSDVAANNAKIAGYQREDALRRGEEDAIQVARQAERIRGTQIASLASNGLDISSGSALSILEDTMYFGSQDAATVRNNAARAAWGYDVQANNAAAESAMYTSVARNQKPGQAAGLSLLSSAGQFAGSNAGQAQMKNWGWA